MIHDPNISEWLREALRTALLRDPVDAANDAETLRILLLRRAAEAEDPDDGDALPERRPPRKPSQPPDSKSR